MHWEGKEAYFLFSIKKANHLHPDGFAGDNAEMMHGFSAPL